MRTYYGIKLTQGQFEKLVKNEGVVVCRGFDGKNISFSIGLIKIDARKRKLLAAKEELTRKLEKVEQELGGKVEFKRIYRRRRSKTCSICGKKGLKSIGHHTNYVHKGMRCNLPRLRAVETTEAQRVAG